MSARTARVILSYVRTLRRSRDRLRMEAKARPEQRNQINFAAWRMNQEAKHWLRHARKEAECEGPCPETVLFNQNAAERRRALQ